MPVPLSKLKSLCTAAELELVRASRSPDLERLSPAELKQSIARARKLHAKWRDQSHAQARAAGQRGGGKAKPAQTLLKAQAFQEALSAFEQRQAALAAGGANTGKKAAPKPKRVRATGHRAARAEMRQGLSYVRIEQNTKSRIARKAAAKTAQQPEPVESQAAPDEAKQAPPRFTPPPVALPKRPPLTGIQKKLAAGAISGEAIRIGIFSLPVRRTVDLRRSARHT